MPDHDIEIKSLQVQKFRFAEMLFKMLPIIELHFRLVGDKLTLEMSWDFDGHFKCHLVHKSHIKSSIASDTAKKIYRTL